MVTYRLSKSIECTANIRRGRGRQCKNRTRRADKCWQHLQSTEHLRIKPSHIPGAGLGLYAAKPQEKSKAHPHPWKGFKKNTRVAKYPGKVLKRAYGNSPSGDYVLTLRNAKKATRHHAAVEGIYVDAPKSTDNAGRFANDCRSGNKRRGECKGNNARLGKARGRNEGTLTASKAIKPNQEILTSYGSGYWNEEKGGKVGRKKSTHYKSGKEIHRRKGGKETSAERMMRRLHGRKHRHRREPGELEPSSSGELEGLLHHAHPDAPDIDLDLGLFDGLPADYPASPPPVLPPVIRRGAFDLPEGEGLLSQDDLNVDVDPLAGYFVGEDEDEALRYADRAHADSPPPPRAKRAKRGHHEGRGTAGPRESQIAFNRSSYKRRRRRRRS